MKLKISIRIILLFTVAISASLLADHLHLFLGDWFCEGRYYDSTAGRYGDYKGCDMFESHNPTWHWGYRHYLFLTMGITLTIVQAVDVINNLKKNN